MHFVCLPSHITVHYFVFVFLCFVIAEHDMFIHYGEETLRRIVHMEAVLRGTRRRLEFLAGAQPINNFPITGSETNG